MWKSLFSVSVALVIATGLVFLSWCRGCYLNKRSQEELLPILDDDPMSACQDQGAGKELFPPDKYLVHARVISVRRDERVEDAELQIERVYVGSVNLKGQTFEAVQYMNNFLGDKELNVNNPPMEVGEVGIWWVRKSGYRDYLEADFGLDLAIVGGCEPARKGIANKSRNGYHYPVYGDALEYAALWKRLYNASDTHGQLSILRQAVVSHNRIISDGAFELLFARRPPGFIECLKELAADPKTPVKKLRVIKNFVDGVGKKQVREIKLEPF